MDERTNERTSVARSVLWLVAGAASLSVACFDTTNGFYAPDGTIKDPAREPYIVRRDNPMLTGRATLGVQSERTEPGYTSVRVISPDGVRVSADTPGVLDENEGWAWTDAPPSSTGAAFADTLRLPRVGCRWAEHP